MDMDMVALLRRYQAYDPATGRFDKARTNREYAALLGVHESYLSRLYNGERPVKLGAVRGFSRAFPHASHELFAALTAPDHEAVTA